MAERQARRPWYLVLALLICSGMGACSSTSGWATIALYRGAQVDNRSHDFQRDEDRTAVTASFDRMLAAMDEERPRAFPLAAGELVLGVAMFIMAAAAMTGRGGARKVLVQLTMAEAALALASFFLTPKTRWGRVDWAVAQQAGKLFESGQTQDQVNRTIPAIRVLYQSIPIVMLVLSTVVSALVVFARTRQRARAYYDSQNERPTEG